ncbi:hypothetical protein EHN07_15555 [Buttiauxella warmboldiae]|uniref:Uncharacterized protein n=1 Tax=Buttiauxella warmboldiae TaxID=82993 RepID=A0A3N5E360_9ENTR|nr:hypothetical protein EHN07_15555 [Buttiauxella warmboldiae]
MPIAPRLHRVVWMRKLLFENNSCFQNASMSKCVIGLEDRPYESSFSKAVLSSSVIKSSDTLLRESPPKRLNKKRSAIQTTFAILNGYKILRKYLCLK